MAVVAPTAPALSLRGVAKSFGGRLIPDRPTRALSGGQRKLVALAACVVRAPDVLLLDEPEAHLDVARRRLVEELVQDFDGAVLIVSHDRHLLDETVGQIAELEDGRIRM